MSKRWVHPSQRILRLAHCVAKAAHRRPRFRFTPETKEFSNMVEVTERSANWRLFGGGGLLVGGLLLLLAALLPLAGTPAAVTFWLGVVGILLVGIALFFVAFGETGSNG